MTFTAFVVHLWHAQHRLPWLLAAYRPSMTSQHRLPWLLAAYRPSMDIKKALIKRAFIFLILRTEANLPVLLLRCLLWRVLLLRCRLWRILRLWCVTWRWTITWRRTITWRWTITWRRTITWRWTITWAWAISHNLEEDRKENHNHHSGNSHHRHRIPAPSLPSSTLDPIHHMDYSLESRQKAPYIPSHYHRPRTRHNCL